MNRKIYELREVITKLVPMLAGKGLVVTQRGSQAFVKTDLRTRKPISVNIPQISDKASDDFIRAIQGFIDHEVAHVLITDFEVYGGAPTPEQMRDSKVRAFMNSMNIIEDTMIEREIVKIFPGSRQNIAHLREHFIEKITKEALKGVTDEKEQFRYLLVPAMRALAGHTEFQDFMNEGDYWNQPLVKGLVDALDPATLTALKTCSSTKETLVIARTMHDILYPPAPPTPLVTTPEDEDADADDQPNKKAGVGSGKGKRDHDEPEEDDEPEEADGPGEGKSTAPEKDEEEDEDDDGGDSDSDDDNANEEDEEKSESDDAEDEAEEDPDLDAEEDDDAGDDAGDDDGSSDDGDDEEDDAGDEDGDADQDDAESDAGSAGSSGDNADDAEGAGGAGEFDPEVENGGDHGEFEDTDEDEGESVAGGGVGSDIAKSMFDFEDDAFEGADISSALALEITEQSVADLADRTEYVVYTREGDRIEPLNVPEINAKWVPELEAEVAQMAGRMQKDIERIMASQSHVIKIAGHRRGKLHAPSLYRVSQGDDRVFTQKQEHISKDTAVSLVVDNSGSMGGAKMRLAMIAAYALSQTLDRVKIAHEVIGFTTGDWNGLPRSLLDAMSDDMRKTGIRYERATPIVMPIYKSFDERVTPLVKKRFAYALNAQRGLNGNIDGESLEYAAQRLFKQPEKRKVMIVLSDGMPAGGPLCEPHLKYVIKDLGRLGVDCIGIGILSDAVKKFYPKHVVLNKVEELPIEVMQKIKELLL